MEGASVALDSSSVIHPFHVHKLDSGPVRLMTIAHAFNYRVAVLRDGVRSALRVGRSRKAERCFLINANIPWGQQVTVMFQIVSTLMAEVPEFELVMRELQGTQPHIQLADDIWGHDGKCGEACACQLSDRTEAFVHCLIPPFVSPNLISNPGSINSDMVAAGFTFRDDCGYPRRRPPGINTICFHEAGARVWSVIISSIRAMEVGIAHTLGLAQTGYSGSVEGCPIWPGRRTGPNARSGRK